MGGGRGPWKPVENANAIWMCTIRPPRNERTNDHCGRASQQAGKPVDEPVCETVQDWCETMALGRGPVLVHIQTQPFRRLVVALLNRQINALQHAVPAHGRPYVWRTRPQIDGTLMPRTAFLAAAKRNATTVVRPPGRVSITAGTLEKSSHAGVNHAESRTESRKRRRQRQRRVKCADKEGGDSS
ncbi:hypothetical protein BGX38DRAFT_1138356 [Terfezia claveryi]|nr:hypothetical protein BGX38DRAFT_1138356 [Terfezia claveryi]